LATFSTPALFPNERRVESEKVVASTTR